MAGNDNYASKRKKDFPCGSCDVHVKKNDYAVQCFLCVQWFHLKKADGSKCCDVDEALFKYLDSQVDYSGGHFWTCKACRVTSLKFDRRFKDFDKRFEAVEAKSTANEGAISKLARGS